jgi:hypothetical protein
MGRAALSRNGGGLTRKMPLAFANMAFDVSEVIEKH